MKPSKFDVALSERLAAIRKNHDAFLQKSEAEISSHAGKYALMRDGSVMKICSSPNEALAYARNQYPMDASYSVEKFEVNKEIHLGMYAEFIVNSGNDSGQKRK